jgi:hypothetical protein
MKTYNDHILYLLGIILIALADENSDTKFPVFNTETFDYFSKIYPSKAGKTRGKVFWNANIKSRGNVIRLYNALLVYVYDTLRCHQRGFKRDWKNMDTFLRNHEDFIDYHTPMIDDFNKLLGTINRLLDEIKNLAPITKQIQEFKPIRIDIDD